MKRLRLGYLPLIDAAPLVVARELGFAAEEGLALELRAFGAWAQVRDMLGAGLVDAAHMLVPMPLGQALGLGPALPAMDLVMFLSHGGQAIAVNRALEARLRDAGHDFAFRDAGAAGRALRAVVAGRLRVGVPFPFSTQLELTSLLLRASGLAPAAASRSSAASRPCCCRAPRSGARRRKRAWSCAATSPRPAPKRPAP